ncbi:hypothetical protein F9L00_19070 [Brucella anthropi]|uniref:Uncharacterized protein n=1 Tax=Brucella anthropi TaxID=529 RepID=A0A6L3Z3M5_BRUAN|nr:hypothetical protein [Brucella anthropi]KAB2766830.1 hypothetical protein F9L04_16305 [Brucella anthropi]KAB2774675.1 hypothetical protein F9L00_19070 [Brucella anthropi]
MKHEHEKQTIQDLIANILSIGPVKGYRTYKEWVGGKLTFTAEPIEPFKVDEDGGVYMQNATVDYEAIDKAVGELMQFLDSRIGTLQNDVLALSAKAGGEYTSHVAMNFYAGEPRLKVEPAEASPNDRRKHVGETFSKACKSWTESIAEATGPRSDLAKTIENLTVRLDPEELYDDLVKSPQFKSAILDALRSGPRTVHVRL